jgi:hypothetical protein
MTDIAMLASLLPASMMHSQWFATLTVFVAVNTLLYLTLAIVKLLPKLYLSDWVDHRDRRSEPLSISLVDDAPTTPGGTDRGGRRSPAPPEANGIR